MEIEKLETERAKTDYYKSICDDQAEIIRILRRELGAVSVAMVDDILRLVFRGGDSRLVDNRLDRVARLYRYECDYLKRWRDAERKRRGIPNPNSHTAPDIDSDTNAGH